MKTKKTLMMVSFLLTVLFLISACSSQTANVPVKEPVAQVEEQIEEIEQEVVAEPNIVEVKTEGFTFSPSEVTIKAGDKVRFITGAAHNSVEVTQETWEKNMAREKPNGFKVGFGKTEEVAFDQPGTYYYICQPHIGLKMKGKVIVN